MLKVLLEARAPWEHAAMLAFWPILKQSPKGDGHTVMVFPGFITGDNATFLLRQFLQSQGFDVHGWNQGRNLGPKPGVIEAAIDELEAHYQRSKRKVTLIGWSLGGIYAREIAKIKPQWVRQVITLASPFASSGEATNAWVLFRAFNPNYEAYQDTDRQLAIAPPVPTTAIYSRTDGIVAWAAARHDEAQLRSRRNVENIEIEASHVGMNANPLVLYAIGDRLAQPEGEWRKFQREGWRSIAYPNPQRPQRFF